jgi:hypothetical protein
VALADGLTNNVALVADGGNAAIVDEIYATGVVLNDGPNRVVIDEIAVDQTTAVLVTFGGNVCIITHNSPNSVIVEEAA